MGALRLLTPLTGRVDYGLVIRLRFRWSSLGAVLAQTGLKVVPELLSLPDLPRSERRVPPWVLSSVVSRRIEAMLAQLSRRFEIVRGDRHSPRGRVDWTLYATTCLPRGMSRVVPRVLPDLRDDEEIHAAIHHELRLEQASLVTQRAAGPLVLELVALCDRLLGKVPGTPPVRPGGGTVDAWRRRPLSTRPFRDGLQALEWALEERGPRAYCKARLGGAAPMGGTADMVARIPAPLLARA